MRRYLVTLDLRLPDNAGEADYVKALLEAVPTKASLVSDGSEPTEQKGESDGRNQG